MHSAVMLLAQVVPEGRLFGLDFQTLISIGIQLFNGIVLAVGLTFILYKPVKEFMRKRRDGIQSKMDNAQETMVKANALIAEYDKKVQEIDIQCAHMLETARLKAADESKSILEEAKQEANEIKKRSLENVDEDRKRLKKETHRYVVELASLIAEKYIAQTIDDQTQDALFEETMAQLETAQWQS